MLEPVATGEFPPFRSIVAHDGDELGVASSMRERREDGHLGNVAEPDDRVTYGLGW